MASTITVSSLATTGAFNYVTNPFLSTVYLSTPVELAPFSFVTVPVSGGSYILQSSGSANSITPPFYSTLIGAGGSTIAGVGPNLTGSSDWGA